jgi:hypothetical protein
MSENVCIETARSATEHTMTNETITTETATYASRAGALRSAKRDGLTGYTIEQVGDRYVVVMLQTNADKDSELVTVQAEVVTPGIPLPVEPVAVEVKTPKAPKAPKPVKEKAVTKQAILHALLVSGKFNVAALADKMGITTTAVSSLFSDLKRKEIAIVTTKVDGGKAEYHVEASAPVEDVDAVEA